MPGSNTLCWNDECPPIALYVSTHLCCIFNGFTSSTNYTSQRHHLATSFRKFATMMLTCLTHICKFFFLKQQMQMRGDTLNSAWICLEHNGTKFIIPLHIVEQGIRLVCLFYRLSDWIVSSCTAMLCQVGTVYYYRSHLLVTAF